jgi:hypothetical protein
MAAEGKRMCGMKHEDSHQYIKFLGPFLFVFALSTLILCGCSPEPASRDGGENGKDQSAPRTADKGQGDQEEKFKVKPVTVEKGEIQSINGWVGKNILAFTVAGQEGTKVITHNIKTGKQQTIYEGEDSIAAVTVSPSGKYLLIQSPQAGNESTITIIDHEGAQLAEETMELYELAVEWNPFDENSLLLSVFNEDWEFQVFRLQISEKKLEKIGLPEPFAQWISKNDLFFLDWSEKSPSLFAPMKKIGLLNGEAKTVLNDLIKAEALPEGIVALSVDQEQEGMSEYTFYDESFQPVSSFSMPHLTRYSDWLVPYYAYDQSAGKFYTFEPLYSTEADAYAEGFRLISYNPDEQTKDTIFEGMENEPLSCSPEGSWCLYGFYFEKLLNMADKTMVDLVKEE